MLYPEHHGDDDGSFVGLKNVDNYIATATTTIYRSTMPHVSRHTPVRKVSDKIFQRLMEAVTTKGTEAQRRAFLYDMLTPTERIMLSKRFAIIYMLSKGYSFSVIQETLRVSPSTVGRIWEAIQKNKYAEIVRRVRPSSNEGDIIRLMQWFADLMPPISLSKKQYADRMRRLKL